MKATPPPSEQRTLIGLACGDLGCEAIYAENEGEETEKTDHNTRHTPPADRNP
jgi:hypothetical protein